MANQESHNCKTCDRLIFSFIETENNFFYCHECYEKLKEYLLIKRVVTSSRFDSAKIYKFKKYG